MRAIEALARGVLFWSLPPPAPKICFILDRYSIESSRFCIGGASAYVLPVTAVSISQAPQAPPPESLNLKTASRADAPRKTAFGSQLREAIQERKGQSKEARQDGKPGDGDDKSKDGQPQLPVIGEIVVAVLPLPLAGAFGLPTAGTDRGQSQNA